MSKLERLLFLQGNRCFFCDQPIPDGEATVEHLQPRSKGGSQEDENCVACCRTMNAMLGNLSVKDKLRALLNQRGQVVCPAQKRFSAAECAEAEMAESERPKSQNSQQYDFADEVIEILNQRFRSRPKKRIALCNLIRTIIGQDASDEELDRVILDLNRLQYLRIDGEKVKYYSDAEEFNGDPHNGHAAGATAVDEDIPF